MKAVCYARVSSVAQRDRHTIASQLDVLPKFIKSQGWTLTRPANTYVDDGHTAKAGHLDKREGFQRLLRDMAKGGIDICVVIDQDRLTRSEDLRERGEVLGAFQRAGVKIAIASTGQVLDLGSSMGDLLANLQGFFGAEENRKRRERTIRGKLEAIRNGKKPAGPTPLGYLYSKESGWALHPVHSKIVVEIFKRTADGESARSIAEDLRRRGVPSSTKRNPGKWTRERIWKIVHDRTYLGEWVADKARNLTVKVPVIVDDLLWACADRALLQFGLRGLSRAKHHYLAQGIAKCGLCGAQMGCGSSKSGGRDGQRNYYYSCTKRRRPEDGPRCTMPMLRVDDVDPKIWTSVEQLLMKPGHIEKAIRARKPTTWAEDLKEYQRKLARNEEAETAIIERFHRDLVSSKVMDATLEKLSKERRLLQRQIEVATKAVNEDAAQRAEEQELLDTVTKLRTNLKRTTPTKRRDILRTLVPGTGEHWVVMYPDRLKLRVVVAAPIARVDVAGSYSIQSSNQRDVLHFQLLTDLHRRPRNARLSYDDVRAIRALASAGDTQSSIAKRYGIAQSNVSSIILGRTWAL